MSTTDLVGPLWGFGLLLLVVCYATFESLRMRFAAVPQQHGVLTAQIQSFQAEIEVLKAQIAKKEAGEAMVLAEIESLTTATLQARQRVDEIDRRLPTTIYVIDQMIRRNHTPWVIMVRRKGPTRGGKEEAEWAKGRLLLVFGDGAEAVQRRMEVRFPATQGFHCGEARPFEGS
jgi:hypothetical protein